MQDCSAIMCEFLKAIKTAFYIVILLLNARNLSCGADIRILFGGKKTEIIKLTVGVSRIGCAGFGTILKAEL